MSQSRGQMISTELPTNLLAIEASAGTGKTHALANLVVRYVVEGGLSIDEILVVTFTRASVYTSSVLAL